MIKKIPEKITLAIIGIAIALVLSENILRLTHLKYLIRQDPGYPRYYHRPDPVLHYDISENFPPAKHSFPGLDYLIWSNELGCFDRPYNGEKDYVNADGTRFSEPRLTASNSGSIPPVVPWLSLPHLALHFRPHRNFDVRVDGGFAVIGFYSGLAVHYVF